MASPVFDAHFHVIDPRHPLVASAGFVPAPFTCADYCTHAVPLGIAGGAVVSGSFQGSDQGYLLDALAILGPTFVGVTQLPPDAPDELILRLDAAGVRAVRFNLVRGGALPAAEIERIARRVHELAGWHVELYLDSRDLAPLHALLVDLPAVALDHLGLSREGFDEVLELAARGARVKATGFGRIDFDAVDAMAEIAAVNPAALMFGTDLPSTRAARPFADTDLALVGEALEPALAARALWVNAVELYRPRAWGTPAQAGA